MAKVWVSNYSDDFVNPLAKKRKTGYWVNAANEDLLKFDDLHEPIEDYDKNDLADVIHKYRKLVKELLQSK